MCKLTVGPHLGTTGGPSVNSFSLHHKLRPTKAGPATPLDSSWAFKAGGWYELTRPPQPTSVVLTAYLTFGRYTHQAAIAKLLLDIC